MSEGSTTSLSVPSRLLNEHCDDAAIADPTYTLYFGRLMNNPATLD
jgi:hypothetical protein